MLKGKFIKPGISEILEVGKVYYLFPELSQGYYVSRFPNRNAHTGFYRKDFFELIEEGNNPEMEPQRTVILDQDKVYKANLTYRKQGYAFNVPLKSYYLEPKMTHAYFFDDPHLRKCRGCFPLEWFDHFEEFLPIAEPEPEPEEVLETDIIEVSPLQEPEQLSLFDF